MKFLVTKTNESVFIYFRETVINCVKPKFIAWLSSTRMYTHDCPIKISINYFVDLLTDVFITISGCSR